MIKPKRKNIYNIYHYGITGKMGKGANTEVNYLQTSLKMKDLETIKLLLEISGSEKWSIKDLFQRNVNRKRINGEKGLKAYFTDGNQVKYFNPIALVILPIDDNFEIETNLPMLNKEENIDFDGINGCSLTNSNHYQLYIPNSSEGNIGKIEWNSETCHVVAIDGQHRLTALKELYGTRGHNGINIEHWEIPVVFIVPNKIIGSGETKDLINVVRKLFMYINMEATEVNEARAILLNDESIESICVQETISRFHSNDFSTLPNISFPPMYLLDWVGDSESSNLRDTRFIFGNIELRNLIRDYLVGEDFKASSRRIDKLQMVRLELQDLNLDFLNNDSCLSLSDGKQIRAKFNDLILNGFLHFITNLSPIKNYIKDCREYEELLSVGNSQLKAFSELRYGYTKKEESNKSEINDFVNEFNDSFVKIKKENMSEFMRQDIAMRGIVFGFCELYDTWKSIKMVSIDWYEHAERFIPEFNKLIDSGWCESWDNLEPFKQRMLTHICHNEAGKRINYKLSDVRNSWGIFVVMEVLNSFCKADNELLSLKEDCWDLYRDKFESTLERGFKDVAKRESTLLEMNDEQRKVYITKEKKEKTVERMEEFMRYWNLK